MTDKSAIIVKPSTAQAFETLWERGRVLFFSAPCGFGKTVLADTLLDGRPVLRLNAADTGFALPSLEDAWDILLIDNFTRTVDGVALSCVQFLVMAVLSAGLMLVMETPDWAGLLACIGPVLYVGIFSSGVGYTLQILAQKDSNPTVVSLLLSLESVFATIAGALILGDRMSGKEYLGCVLMLAAVVLAQLPDFRKKQAVPAPEN